MRSAPSISVVVPVHNGGPFLEAAVESIERQDRRYDLEIIVVDDGSTDDTPDVIGRLGGRVRTMRQDQSGPSAARNTGISTATGELLAFLDADDRWPDDKLEYQVAALVDDPALDVVLGRISYLPLGGGITPDVAFEDPERRTISNVHLGSGLYRRRSFDRVGGFDETLRFSEDHDWFLRAREAGLRIRILDRVTLLYQLHDRNMTRGRGPDQVMLAEVLKRSLDRRRRRTGVAGDLPRWSSYDDRIRDRD
jgi:glycosyltransferase involved in cell wall biosynthesis